jgi:putative transposase
MSNSYSGRAFKHYQSMSYANHNRPSTGAYTITISALDYPQDLLKMPGLSSIITEEWQHLPERFAGVTLDAFMLLPDHLHCIIWNNEQIENAKSMGNIIGAFKSLVVVTWIKHLKATGEIYPGKIWQGRFYDHSIRNEKDLHDQQGYMQNNPQEAKIKDAQRAAKHVCKYASCGHIPFPPQ